MTRTKILIVDDHDVVRRGLAAMLAAEEDLEVCGEALNGRDGVKKTAELHPDIVIMDISMPEMNGLDATRQILHDHPGTQILVLTLHESEELVRNLLAAGARGYVLKSNVVSNLLPAIRALEQRCPYMSSRVADLVLRGYLGPAGGIDLASQSLETVSSREREIIQLIAEGNSNKEVAVKLNISVKTVETHRAHVMSKLKLHSVADLVRYAIRNHIVTAA